MNVSYEYRPSLCKKNTSDKTRLAVLHFIDVYKKVCLNIDDYQLRQHQQNVQYPHLFGLAPGFVDYQ
jgi:hypothetical protein